MTDLEFLAEIKKREYDLDVTSGEEREALAEEVFAQPEAIVERMKKLLEK